MADEGADRSGVANSDVSPREDDGVDDVGGRRERSSGSSGGDPCTVEILCVRGIRQNSEKRPPAGWAGSRSLSALVWILRVLEWEGGWGNGAVAPDDGDLLKIAKFGHEGSLGGPRSDVERGVRTGLTDNEIRVDLLRRTALAGNACSSTGVRWRK